MALDADSGAKYCGTCGGFVVNLTRHEASRLHRDTVRAETLQQKRSPRRDASEVRARMARDPAFAALLLGPEPRVGDVDLEEE